MSPIKKEKKASELYQDLCAGRNSYMRVDRLATSYFDMTWIAAIEDVLFDLGDIVKNPREVTKTEAQLVPVELARKVNSESVRHLASHTQYIKNITDEGDVVPNKILTIANEEDIHTYENRFIATLIRRLVIFIQKRYDFIRSFTPLRDEKILYVKNKSIINGAEVEIETKVKIKSESETSIADVSDKYIKRIEDIREYVLYYYGSQFMRKLKTDRDVRNPIIMTNILRKNPKYHKCYELYRFIERYQQLGVSYRVNEQASMLTEEEMDELNTVSFTNYLALQDKDRSKKTKVTQNKEYKPKILTSIDDEQFVYGELLKGPFNFVRIDDEYQAYLDSKVKKDLPQYPTKAEREYYRDEYADRKENKEDHIQLDKLKKRKSKEALENEKRIQKIIAQREKEEAERRRQEEEAARLAEEARFNKVRQEIIDAARGNRPEEEKPQEEAKATGYQFLTGFNPLEEKYDEIFSENPLIDNEEKSSIIFEKPIYDGDNYEAIFADLEIKEPTRAIFKANPSEEEEPLENSEIFAEEPVVDETPDNDVIVEQTDDAIFTDQPEIIPQPIEEEPTEETPIEEPAEEAESVEENPVEEVVEEPITEETPSDEVPAEEIQPEEQPQEEAKEEPVEEAPVEETPAQEPVQEELAPVEEESQTESEPEPVQEEQTEQPEEPQPEEQPKEEVKPEEPAPKKRRGRKPSKKVEPVEEQSSQDDIPSEETPKVEPEEEIKEEVAPEEVVPVEEQPQVEIEPEPAPAEEPVQEEQPAEQPAPKKKKARKPAKKEEKPQEVEPSNEPESAPAEEPVQEEPKVKEEQPQKQVKDIPEEEIPGKFIVKTLDGYYCGKNKYSVYKHDALIFYDFNKANKIKKELGGKVVKL